MLPNVLLDVLMIAFFSIIHLVLPFPLQQGFSILDPHLDVTGDDD